MPAVQQDNVKKIVALWDQKAELTPELKTYWLSLTTAQRREIYQDYNYEVEGDE